MEQREHFYLIIVKDGVSPELLGPFRTEELRDMVGERHKEEFGAQDTVLAVTIGVASIDTVSLDAFAL